MSGITPSDAALAIFNKTKTSKIGFSVFAIDNQKTVECIHEGPKFTADADTYKDTDYQKIVEYAGENLLDKAAYIVFNFCYKTDDGRIAHKLEIISWCPEKKIKVIAKMLHGSTLGAIKSGFEGLQYQAIQASTLSEMEYEEIFSEIKSH